MQRDRAINLFLFFVLAALLFVSFYPIYFAYDHVSFRVVDISERLFSLLYVMLWIALCVYASWKRKIHLVLGAAAFAVLAYIPDWAMPLLESRGSGSSSVVKAIFRFIFERIYELVNAPMVGFSILFSEKTSVSLSKWLLPVLLISYAGTQIFRHYRNAYLADKLHLEETAYYPNPDLAHEIATPRVSGFPSPSAPPSKTTSTPPANDGLAPMPAPAVVPPAEPAEPAEDFDVIDLAAIRRVAAPAESVAAADVKEPVILLGPPSPASGEDKEDPEEDATRRFFVGPQ